VTFELGRALLLSGTVTSDGLSKALAVTLDPGMPLARAVIGLGLVSEQALQETLSHSSASPALTAVDPRRDLLTVLPPGLCSRLAALPVDIQPDGTIIVAVLDPRDTYIADEFAFHLRRPVRLVRAPYPILWEALVNYATGTRSIVPPPGPRRDRVRPVSYTPAWGTQLESAEPPSDQKPSRSFSSIPQPPAVVASVTTSTRRFFAGMHSAPSEPPRPPAMPMQSSIPPPDEEGHHEPVFELRRGPHMTLRDLEPPTQRTRDEPAFPMVASLPTALTSLATMSEYFPDPASTLGQLREAQDRDEVLALVEKSARAVAKRVALLVVRKDALVGWSCTAEFGNADGFRALSISTRTPSLLKSVLEGGVYLGPLLGSVGRALLQVMRSATRDVAIVAIRVAGKPAVVVVCDDLTDTLLATRHLDIVAKVAGEALERVVRAKRDSTA